jgi:glutamate dehydrogenase (NAD(P)+)
MSWPRPEGPEWRVGPEEGSIVAVRIQELDLEDTVSSGPVRWARKILQGGAQDLARSQTYTYAALGMKRGGASAGISAEADERDEAVAAFVEEMGPLVGAGTYLPDSAKGVSEDDLAPLREADPRNTDLLMGDPPPAIVAEAAGVVAAADAAVGLDGRTVAIEGFEESGPALVEGIVARGGSVVSIATTAGAITPTDTDPAALAEAWTAHGPEFVGELGQPDAAWKVFAAGAEVLFAGSKMGAVNHETAGRMEGLTAIVPIGRLPFTAKALAVFRRAGIAALPDFVTMAGSTIALWGDATATADLRGLAETTVSDLVAAAMANDDGPFLGACYAAESFLRTWQESLPFGRPLAP